MEIRIIEDALYPPNPECEGCTKDGNQLHSANETASAAAVLEINLSNLNINFVSKVTFGRYFS